MFRGKKAASRTISLKAFLVLGGVGVLAVVAFVLVKGTHFYAYSEVTDAQGRTSVHCYAGCDVVDSITGGASSPEIDDALHSLPAPGQ